MRTLLLALVALLVLPAAARADTVVALGDSAISGEAGRWAGNTNGASSRTDALGSTAYHDVAGAESTPGCHRSKAAEVHIGGAAWSATTWRARAHAPTRAPATASSSRASTSPPAGRPARLQELATTDKNIKAVVVLIGANDYGFADIVQTCVTNWLTSPSWWKNYCRDDASMVSMFSAANIAKNTTAVRNAFLRIKQAMAAAAATRTSPSGRSSPRPTPRRSRAAPASATPRRAGRARRSAAAASGTATPTGRATPS